jgi:predicted MFS family arabinose efflux permease
MEASGRAVAETQLGPRRVSPKAWQLLAAALLVQTGISIGDQGLPALTGFIKTDAGLSAASAGLFVSSFVFGRCLASYPAGIAADRLGERRVLATGGVLCGLLVVLAAATPIPLILAVLVVAGLASAVATPAGGRLILTSFPRTHQGLALGLRQSGVPIGGLIAAAILPWVAHATGWRWALALAGLIAIACVIPLVLSKHDPEPQEDPAAELTVEGSFSVRGNRNIRLLTVWGSMLVSGQYAVLTFLGLDLHQRMGLGLAEASAFVAIAQAGGIAGRIGWGALSDRLLSRGRKPLLLALTAAGLTAVGLFYALPASTPAGLTAVAVALVGVGVIGFQGLMIAMIADAAGPANMGAATGWSVTFVQVTVVAAAPLYGLAADWSGSYHTIFAVLTAVLALAFVPAALIRES